MAKFEQKEEAIFEYVPCSGEECNANQEMKNDFQNNGFLIVRNVFPEKEICKLLKSVDDCPDFWKSEFGVKDKENKTFFQTQWLDVGTDILGLAARTQKTVGIAEQLLDKGEIYLYSAKIIMKQEKTGGALLWHQDYGYWYNNRCLFPDFIMCFIALTKNDRENGGLQVLKGSHKCGRIDHGKTAGQQGADEERVEMLKKALPLVHCDLKAGDVIFFHGNTLHASAANDSEFRRWNLIFSYNARHNSPDKEHYNNQYGPQSKIDKLPFDAVEKCESTEVQKRKFLDPAQNHNIDFVNRK